MEIDLEMDHSTISVGTAETMDFFPVLHRPKGETSYKIFFIAYQELICLTVPTIDPLLVLHITNKNSHKAIIRPHLMLLPSPQPMMPLMNYQIFAC